MSGFCLFFFGGRVGVGVGFGEKCRIITQTDTRNKTILTSYIYLLIIYSSSRLSEFDKFFKFNFKTISQATILSFPCHFHNKQTKFPFFFQKKKKKSLSRVKKSFDISIHRSIQHNPRMESGKG